LFVRFDFQYSTRYLPVVTPTHQTKEGTLLEIQNATGLPWWRLNHKLFLRPETSIMRPARFSLLVVLLAISSSSLRAAEALQLPLDMHVDAGSRERIDVLCHFSLPGSLEEGKLIRLVETTGGKASNTPVQLDGNNRRLCWIVNGATKAGEKRTYRLEAGTPAESPAMEVIDSERVVNVSYQKKPLLQYNKAHVKPPADLNPKFGRSAHLHPVQTSTGAIVTDEFPPDHAHQSGIFFAFTRTKFEDRDVDFWNLAGAKGRVRFKKLNHVSSGPVFGRIQVEHEHVDLTSDAAKSNDDGMTGGKVALLEDWDVQLWPAGWNSGYWLLDITTHIRCATDSPLHLPEYHYGGIAIRAARTWTPPLPKFLTSEGADRIQGNHTRPRWCDVVGPIKDRPAGVTLMTHPENFRFPEPLRIHPTMPYMVYTPQFLGAWEIQPGKTYASRYRFVIHDGELPADKLDQLWRDYAEPLQAQAGS
jgi:hypothetical protein